MSEKTLRMSLYFLASVALLYGLSVVLGGRVGDSAPGGDPGLAAALEEIDPVLVSQVEITGPRDTIRLLREGTEWSVNGFEADSGAVSRLMRALEEAEVASVAATNPANHGRLGLDADSAWTLAVDDDVRVLLGKAGTRFRTAYARLPDEDVASLIQGDLRSAAARSLLDWRDKIVLRADTAAIASIRVTRDGDETLFERSESTWMVGDDEADPTTVQNILQELSGLRATGFAAEDAERPSDDGEADRSVQAMNADGEEVASLFLTEQEGNFRVATPASPYVFEVPTYRADRVAPAPPGDGGDGSGGGDG